jgi:hypothetical protein
MIKWPTSIAQLLQGRFGAVGYLVEEASRL